MQDDRVLFDGPGVTKSLPAWTHQDQWRLTSVNVHGDGTTTGQADNNIWLTVVVCFLGSVNGDGEVIVIKVGFNDLMTMFFQEGRFVAAGLGMPAGEEEDFQRDFRFPGREQRPGVLLAIKPASKSLPTVSDSNAGRRSPSWNPWILAGVLSQSHVPDLRRSSKYVTLRLLSFSRQGVSPVPQVQALF